MNIMKIVYCINGTYNSGGMERVLMLKANYLVEKVRCEVSIVTTQQFGRRNFFEFSPKIHFYDLGINYDEFKHENLLIRSIDKLKKMRRHRKQLACLLSQLRPDVCISMFDFDFEFLYDIKDGSKKILEYHFCKDQKVIEANNLVMKMIQRIRILVWKRKIVQYDKFVVLTNEDRMAWGNLSNICVIPNFLPSLPDIKAELINKKVLSIGRISFQKGFDLLVQAWSLVSCSYPDWKLIIRGNGDSTKLWNMINKLHLSESIFIKPATDNIQEEYLNSSLFVMSSRYEGLPMVLLEAMSYGLPIVTFACPCGPRDIIQHSYGTLVSKGDIHALADAIKDWIAHKEKRKSGGINARVAVSQYSQDEIMRSWIELLNSMQKPL